MGWQSGPITNILKQPSYQVNRAKTKVYIYRNDHLNQYCHKKSAIKDQYQLLEWLS